MNSIPKVASHSEEKIRHAFTIIIEQFGNGYMSQNLTDVML